MDYIVHGVAKSWTRLTDFHFTSHRLKFPLSPALRGVDSGRSDGDNGLPAVLIKLGIESTLETESPKWKWMHTGQLEPRSASQTFPASDLSRGLQAVVTDQTPSSSFIHELTTDSCYILNVDLKKTTTTLKFQGRQY